MRGSVVASRAVPADLRYQGFVARGGKALTPAHNAEKPLSPQ